MWKLSHKSRWMSPPLNRRLLYHPVDQKFAQNRSISYGFPGIDTFSFSAKIQDGRRKWRKLKFPSFAQETHVPPCGSKIHSKSLYLLRFSRYWHFLIFRENPRWPPKVTKIETRGSLTKKKIMFLLCKNKASRKGYKGECQSIKKMLRF